MTLIWRKTQKPVSLASRQAPPPLKGVGEHARVPTSGLCDVDAAPVVVMDAARGGKQRSPGAEPGGADRKHMFYLQSKVENAH